MKEELRPCLYDIHEGKVDGVKRNRGLFHRWFVLVDQYGEHPMALIEQAGGDMVRVGMHYIEFCDTEKYLKS